MITKRFQKVAERLQEDYKVIWEVMIVYSAMKVARYIIAHESEQGRSVTNLRLQKLMYFVQAQFLVERNKPCFDAEIEAWSFGPVVPETYHVFKFYGASEIPPRNIEEDLEWIYPSDRDSIDMILDDCAQYSTTTLIDITHRQKPWEDAISSQNRIITNSAIRRYFE